MAISIVPMTINSSNELLPHYVDLMACSNDPFSCAPLPPTHLVRIIVRVSDNTQGENDYVDGNTYCFRVDEDSETATLLWEDEAFNDIPSYHGGNITDALEWVNVLAEPFYIQIKDPFLV